MKIPIPGSISVFFPVVTFRRFPSCCQPSNPRGFLVTDVEILRLHYAETLKAWRERSLARRNEAKGLYDERFCRMWEFYLSVAECEFRYARLMVFQVQLTKSLDVVPFARDYIAAREGQLRGMDMCRAPANIAAE